VNMRPDGMAVVPEIPQSLSTVHSFEQGQGPTRSFHLMRRDLNCGVRGRNCMRLGTCGA
jgi:hypothetical protein